MEQTPTFRCIKKHDLLHASVGDVIKMSPKSVAELDEDKRFTNWRKSFTEITLKEELSLINN